MQQKEIEFLKASLLENKSNDEINKIEKNYQKKIFQLQQEYGENSSISSSQRDNTKLLEIFKTNEPSPHLIKEKETILKVKSKNNISKSFLIFFKEKIDNIITTLSQQNDPKKLHSVAKELLSLQKMIKKLTNNLNTVTSNSEFPSPSEIMNQDSTSSSRNNKKNHQNEENYKPKKMFTLSKYQNNNYAGLSSYGNKR